MPIVDLGRISWIFSGLQGTLSPPCAQPEVGALYLQGVRPIVAYPEYLEWSPTHPRCIASLLCRGTGFR